MLSLMYTSLPFQSTLPVWGGTRAVCETFRAIHDFNPPSPCGEGLRHVVADVHILAISIHPPRVGRDFTWASCFYSIKYFNPPSPCGEGHAPICGWHGRMDFNPPSPCGEGPGLGVPGNLQRAISIHPPRVGRDGGQCTKNGRNRAFQSTLPVWGGTAKAHKNSL